MTLEELEKKVEIQQIQIELLMKIVVDLRGKPDPWEDRYIDRNLTKLTNSLLYGIHD